MEFNLLHIRQEQFVVSQWSGGKTTQLAISPKEAVYADREFLWRLSSATVELEESDFTPLPDYNRLISVLEGEMRLDHGGEETVHIQPYTVYSFDGGVPTHSEGRCVDFNLMLRKGRCSGSLQTLCAEQPGSMSLTPVVQSPVSYPNCTLALFCGKGSAAVSAGERSAVLEAQEMVLLEFVGSQPVELAWTAESRLILAQIHF